VQRRHRRVLVGGNRTGVRGAEAGRGDRVDVAGAGQQPRRHHRVEVEHDQPDHVGEHQRVAGLAVRVGPAQVAPAEHDQRHRQVGQLIPPAGDQQQRVVGDQPAVAGQLEVEVQPALDRQHVVRVVQRRPGPGDLEPADLVVHLDQDDDDDQLAEQGRPARPDQLLGRPGASRPH